MFICKSWCKWVYFKKILEIHLKINKKRQMLQSRKEEKRFLDQN